MVCKTCGYNNEDGFEFCQQCGSPLNQNEENQDTSEEIINEEVQETPEINEETQEISEEIEETQETPEIIDEAPKSEDFMSGLKEEGQSTEKKKKSRIPVIVALVVVAVLALGTVSFAALGGFSGNLFKSDAEKLMDAHEKTAEAQQKVVQGQMYFDSFELSGDTVPSDFALGTVIESFDIKYKMAMDQETKMFEGTFVVGMGRAELVTLHVQFNDEYVAIEVPELYSKMVYVKWEDLPDYLVEMDILTEEEVEEMEEILSELDYNAKMDAYKAVFDVESYDSYQAFDHNMYESKMLDVINGQIGSVEKGVMEFETIEDDLVIEGDVYTLDLDYEAMIDGMIPIIEMLLEDEAVKPMILEGIDKFFDVAIAEEEIAFYNLYMASEGNGEGVEKFNEDVEDLYNEWADMAKEELDDNWDDVIEEVQDFMADELFEQMIDLVVELAESVEYEQSYLVKDGYLAGTKTRVTVTDEVLDVLADYDYDDLNDAIEDYEDEYDIYMGSIDSDEFDDLDMKFEFTIVFESNTTNLDEPIEFRGLSEDAQDLTQLDQMELFGILMEIQENLGVMSEGFDF